MSTSHRRTEAFGPPPHPPGLTFVPAPRAPRCHRPRRRPRRPLQWTRMSRPPLPPGPFLLVGLARSGRAAGLILRALGEQVTGCDGAAVAPEARAELEAAGVPVHEHSDGVALLDGVGT